MHIIKKHGLFKSRMRVVDAYKIILHHTAGNSLKGAEDTLIQRGLGYHYMIDKDGSVYEYVPPHRRTAHALGNNTGTIGISYVGGVDYSDPINPLQHIALLQLCIHLTKEFHLAEISGHKHVDPRSSNPKAPHKIDPIWPGDTADGYKTGANWKNDLEHMLDIVSVTGLEFIGKNIK